VSRVRLTVTIHNKASRMASDPLQIALIVVPKYLYHHK
ncbi:unnamed protein product, partial [marine sediment metagenome]